MKKSNLYTRCGDSGETSLVGGTRVAKCSLRLQAYGTIDELNATLGVLVALMPDECSEKTFVRHIQNTLFVVGSSLATDLDECELHETSRLPEEEVAALEQHIDALDEQLPPLRRFVLPGGTQAAAQAHVCRTVCRRAERHICSLATFSAIAPCVQEYVNRLSDYLFVLSRHLNHAANTPEFFWGDV